MRSSSTPGLRPSHRSSPRSRGGCFRLARAPLAHRTPRGPIPSGTAAIEGLRKDERGRWRRVSGARRLGGRYAAVASRSTSRPGEAKACRSSEEYRPMRSSQTLVTAEATLPLYRALPGRGTKSTGSEAEQRRPSLLLPDLSASGGDGASSRSCRPARSRPERCPSASRS